MPRVTNRRIASTIAATALVAAGLVTGAGTASAADTSSEGSTEHPFFCGKVMVEPPRPLTCYLFGQRLFELPQSLS
ncbi:hypothetical protein SAMN05444583_106171 [Rhodococcus maanshanensis]|uniref:Porin n=1 Tax=Rhodococcus maanshanensis TaxID=183556 RepID=A0A1H7MWH9_9NOCA|nr:hypothetical protein SAMN05444583_106171 [Rhodococcus maanshanensis]